MALSTQCPGCRTVLTVPDDAAGRRLKCPKCATRFTAGQADRPASSLPAMPVPRPGSSTDSLRGAPPTSDLALPVAAADPFGTYELPIMAEESFGAIHSSAKPGREVADAGDLFREDPPAARKPTGAAARMQMRRCPACTNVVPAGTSLCSRCGLDLDTGRRESLLDLIDEPPPPPPPSGPPLDIILIGGLGMAAAVILGMLSLLKVDNPLGKYPLIVVCAFGGFAAFQFLRGKSARPLLAALLIGAVVDVLALIVMPVVEANESAVVQVEGVDPDDVVIKPYAERVDATKIKWGVALLLAEAAMFVYLGTGGVRRHFATKR